MFNEPVICLAPMVRAGSLPFRSLCLKYGADLVWSEEIIDKRIMKCERIINNNLQTIDFVIEEGNVLVFRTTILEKSKVIFQLGTASGEVALAAAKVVENDVAGIDVNMGCPKKFSMQGGMGASLLTNPEKACEIIRTLSSNLSIPVTVKIRLLESVEATISFMRQLQDAGASAITVHLRTKSTSSNSPANWSILPILVKSVSIPVLANGDVYTMADAEYLIHNTGCAGVMMGRPLLLNTSLLSKPSPIRKKISIEEEEKKNNENVLVSITNSYIPISNEQKECWKTLNQVICDFLEECVKYDPPFPIVKYTIQEMMSQRRHCQERLKFLKQSGLNYGRMNSIYQTLSSSRSLSEMCEIFELPELSQKALLIPLFKSLSKKRPISEITDNPNEIYEECRIIELKSDHRCENSYFDEKVNDIIDNSPPQITSQSIDISS